ncbi:MAG: hypothetical protein JXA24_07860 [Proteobacteria bacterium]|nr:hypothetical protein [Pseudomonadota bacterium]
MDHLRRQEMIEALRKLLSEGFEGTQEEICEELAGQGFEVNQSTVSRALRRVGAVKSMAAGRIAYRLGEARSAGFTGSVSDLVQTIDANDTMIAIRTVAGSASFVAEFLDRAGLRNVLGIVAGDDTIFVAPRHTGEIATTLEELRQAVRGA